MLQLYTALIVDDREISYMELKRLKVWGEISGFEIKNKANNGKQALDLLRESLYDLVLTDIRMPIVDGLQLLHEIKKESLCSCVVLISEHSEFHYARQGIILGAFDYLVKPADEKGLLNLLKRAKYFLNNLYDNNQFPLLLADNAEENQWFYPIAEEKQLVYYFKSKDLTILTLFGITLDNIYTGMPDNVIKADLIVKKLYHTIITTVYDEYPWLGYYIDIHYFEEIDYFHEGNADSFKLFYIRKIEYLINFIIKYEPPVNDDTIKEIINYIINHSESDLKLKVLASKFFINNTYLSNTFSTKTGIHYNDYVTSVKMARAEFLFKHSDFKTYEIGYQLGYKDINYFSKQFKKTYGISPTEYRNTDFSDYQI